MSPLFVGPSKSGSVRYKQTELLRSTPRHHSGAGELVPTGSFHRPAIDFKVLQILFEQVGDSLFPGHFLVYRLRGLISSQRLSIP